MPGLLLDTKVEKKFNHAKDQIGQGHSLKVFMSNYLNAYIFFSK